MVARDITGEGDGMLWLWADIPRRHLRASDWSTPGEVLLTVRVARKRVLVSDFDAWHDVLNRYLHVSRISGETTHAWDARADAIMDKFWIRVDPYLRLPIEDWPVDLRAKVESSWGTIFDPDAWPRSGSRQATMRELRAADVVRAVRVV
jgi:hypothetical protein